MIRPFTCVCMLLAGGSGLYLYQEKHRTAEIDTEIEHVIKDIRSVKEQTALLRADWAVLNTPDRLGELAQRFLALKQTEPAQFVQYAELASHLPPIAPPQADPAAETDGDTPDTAPIPSLPAVADAGTVVAGAPAGDTARPADGGAALAASAPPADAPSPALAEATSAPRLDMAASSRPDVASTARTKPALLAASETPRRHAPSRATTVLASAGSASPGGVSSPPSAPFPVTHTQPRPAALPHSLLARAEAAAAGPVVVTSAMAIGRPTPPMVGSALGTGRASLPPPVPISASFQTQ